MKILQVIPYFYPSWSFGGPVRVVYDISRELAAKGHEVTVFATNALNFRDDFKTSRHEYLIDGVSIRYFKNSARFAGMYFSAGMFRALKKKVQNSDVVHMHEYRTFQNVLASYVAGQCRKPYVLTAHGSVPRVFESFVRKKLFDQAIGYRILKGAAAVCAASKIEMKQYLDAGVSQDRVALIPNGIDCELFERLPEPGTFRQRFQLDSDAPVILYVGRVHRRKGIDFLMDAFAQLKRTDVLLCIVGDDDGYMSELKERATRLGINKNVVFTCFVSNKDKLAAYVDSAVLVYPSIYESFGLVPLESALCSKPVVVSSDSVMAEIVGEGGFGMTAKYGDSAQLMNILQNILSNPETAKEMGKKGRQFVKANYNWTNIMSKLETVYSNLIHAD